MVTAARRLNVFASCLRGITAEVIIAEGELQASQGYREIADLRLRRQLSLALRQRLGQRRKVVEELGVGGLHLVEHGGVDEIRRHERLVRERRS